MMPSVPRNPTFPTAYPNLRNIMAPRIVEIAVRKTGEVPRLALLLTSLSINENKKER